MGPIAPALPWIAKGGAALGAALLGRKGAQASGQASVAGASPEERAATTGQLGAAKTLAGQGGSLFRFGQPLMEQSAGYYGRLLSGDRASMTQAMQPEIGAISDVYRGAGRSLERGGLRGARREQAQGELAREKAGRISGLIPGVRPAAAESLMGLGERSTTSGMGATGAAGSLFGGTAGQLAQNRFGQAGLSRQAGQDTGRLIFDILTQTGGKGGKKTMAAGIPGMGGAFNPLDYIPG